MSEFLAGMFSQGKSSCPWDQEQLIFMHSDSFLFCRHSHPDMLIFPVEDQGPRLEVQGPKNLTEAVDTMRSPYSSCHQIAFQVSFSLGEDLIGFYWQS